MDGFIKATCCSVFKGSLGSEGKLIKQNKWAGNCTELTIGFCSGQWDFYSGNSEPLIGILKIFNFKTKLYTNSGNVYATSDTKWLSKLFHFELRRVVGRKIMSAIIQKS